MTLVCGVSAILALHTLMVSAALWSVTVILGGLVLLWFVGDVARQIYQSIFQSQGEKEL